MVVYQALRRIVGRAKVLAVLDGSNYDESKRDSGENSSDNSNPSSQDILGSKSYLANELFSTELHDWYDQDLYYVDPESIGSVFKKKVTWLNGEPRSFEELAFVYTAVSELHLKKTFPLIYFSIMEISHWRTRTTQRLS